MQKKPAQRPYERSSMSLRTYVRVEAPVEKIIMYMPVAEATGGGTPKPKSIGLKMLPPPCPSAPDTSPPTNAVAMSIAKLLPYRGISLFVSPLPCFILMCCTIRWR